MKVNSHVAAVEVAPPNNTLVSLKNTARKEAHHKAPSTLESDVYYGAGPNEAPSTYERPFYIGESIEQIETIEQTMDRLFEASSELYLNGDMFNAADAMAAEYASFMSGLSKSHPQLAEKEWGFSVDANSEITVTGSLNEQERKWLTEQLNDNEILVNTANAVKDNFLKYTALERGPNGEGSSKYWGKYDVTNENFSDIINMRLLIEQGQEIGPKTVQIGHTLTPFNFVQSMGEQLKNNAHVTYAV
ncbi:hypothetical protein L1286_20360 [Pseudoalteromonas sp. SMS1]|uniref:hypothetical protein n=1 Tax=Pseudoalteromonas sp. SMS1 TaxID=2908894 RepID=UPI001F262CF2|nr:hypothetical protein [Pseudoalteromonas sp. SMS1]MCF2859840.1 hypothetical protein [Pseudoalteromonas sp. SMS1]